MLAQAREPKLERTWVADDFRDGPLDSGGVSVDSVGDYPLGINVVALVSRWSRRRRDVVPTAKQKNEAQT